MAGVVGTNDCGDGCGGWCRRRCASDGDDDVDDEEEEEDEDGSGAAPVGSANGAQWSSSSPSSRCPASHLVTLITACLAYRSCWLGFVCHVSCASVCRTDPCSPKKN